MKVWLYNLPTVLAFFVAPPLLALLFALGGGGDRILQVVFPGLHAGNPVEGWVRIKNLPHVVTCRDQAKLLGTVAPSSGSWTLWVELFHNHDHGFLEVSFAGQVKRVSGFDPDRTVSAPRWVSVGFFKTLGGPVTVRLLGHAVGADRPYNHIGSMCLAPFGWDAERVARSRRMLPFHDKFRKTVTALLLLGWLGFVVWLFGRWKPLTEPILPLRRRAGREWVLHRLALLVGAILLLFTLFYSAFYSCNLPYWDEWAIAGPFLGMEPVSLSWLWAPQNEHRLCLPKLLNLALAQVTRWDVRAEALLVPLLVGGALLFYARTLSRLHRHRPWFGMLVLPFLVLNLGQGINFLWGIQTARGAVAFCTALAVWHFSAAEYNWRQAVFVLLAVAGAYLSSAHGVVLSLVVCLCALCAAIPQGKRAPLLLTAAVCAVLIPIYFIGYATPGHGGGDTAWCLAHMDQCLSFLLVFLGSPFSGGHLGLAAGVGFLYFVLLFTLVGVLLIRLKPQEIPVLARRHLLLWFSLALALSLAWGRTHLGVETALSSRYVTFGVLPWVGWFFLAAHVRSTRDKRTRRVVDVLAVAVTCLALFGYARGVTQGERAAHEMNLRMSDTIESVLHGASPGESIYPDPRDLLKRMRLLRQHRLALFANREARLRTAHLDTMSESGLPFSGWRVISGLREESRDGNGWRLRSVDGDPMLEFKDIPSGRARHLFVRLRLDRAAVAQVFWDTGQGFRQPESACVSVEPGEGEQSFRIPLPDGEIRALRLDPTHHAGSVVVILELRVEGESPR